jgi:molybdenum cofactor synthesis domain-containing protein
MPKIVSVNISLQKGEIKIPQSQGELTSAGLVGDAHAGSWHRQVSLLGIEQIDGFGKQSGCTFRPGAFAENLTTEGITLSALKLRDRLVFSSGAELEVTQIGKECHGGGCAIFREVGRCVMPKEGIFTRVIRGGIVGVGHEFVHEPRPLNVRVVTVSDRASRGEYADKSGPLLAERLSHFLRSTPWGFSLSSVIVPDEAEPLRRALEGDLIFTTGGTGIGPRDITVDVVKPLLTKEIPGVMEAIRAKHVTLPSACLSRGVAGVMGESLVYTLPGSPKAVAEYLDEIFRSLSHALQMLHGYNAH